MYIYFEVGYGFNGSKTGLVSKYPTFFPPKVSSECIYVLRGDIHGYMDT